MWKINCHENIVKITVTVTESIYPTDMDTYFHLNFVLENYFLILLNVIAHYIVNS